MCSYVSNTFTCCNPLCMYVIDPNIHEQYHIDSIQYYLPCVNNLYTYNVNLYIYVYIYIMYIYVYIHLDRHTSIKYSLQMYHLLYSVATTMDLGEVPKVTMIHDVICFIKKYICDAQLAQDPMLVLTHHRASGFSLLPTEKILGYFCFLTTPDGLHILYMWFNFTSGTTKRKYTISPSSTNSFP